MYLKEKGIYSITNKVNNKRYVGQTGVSFEDRWKNERHGLRKDLDRPNKHLQNSWNKYGEESFEFEILEIIENPTKKSLTEREQHWSDFYKSNNRKFGYNKGEFVESSLGVKHSEGTKAKMKGRFAGVPRTKEVREKISKGWTKEVRKNHSEKISGEKHPRYNPVLRDEEKIKHLYYEEGLSQTKIANLLGVGQTSISRVIRGVKAVREGKKIIEVKS